MKGVLVSGVSRGKATFLKYMWMVENMDAKEVKQKAKKFNVDKFYRRYCGTYKTLTVEYVQERLDRLKKGEEPMNIIDMLIFYELFEED